MSKRTSTRATTPSFLGGEQRINKLLAAAGLGSRRQVDELITEGRVEIDGKTVTQVGVKVDADTARITVDGEALRKHRPVYFAVHKPAGVLCTNRDPEGRPRVIDLVPSQARLFPVGRLDANSTGLILLTNDGELAQRLAHPKHCVPKTYFVVVAGQVDRESMKRLERGIYLAEGVARVDGATIRRVRKGCTEIDITLSEGKNREIRRVLARLGHKVVVLRRVAIGPLRLADMPEGSYRPLDQREIGALYQAVDDIRKKHNQERRERRKRNAESHSDPDSALSERSGHLKSEMHFSPYDEESDGLGLNTPVTSPNWDDESEMMEEDSFPSIRENPYAMEEDLEQDGDEFSDAILVNDLSGENFSTRRGAVLAFDDDEELDSEDAEFDSNGLSEEIDEESTKIIQPRNNQYRKERKEQRTRVGGGESDRARKPNNTNRRPSRGGKNASSRSRFQERGQTNQFDNSAGEGASSEQSRFSPGSGGARGRGGPARGRASGGPRSRSGMPRSGAPRSGGYRSDSQGEPSMGGEAGNSQRRAGAGRSPYGRDTTGGRRSSSGEGRKFSGGPGRNAERRNEGSRFAGNREGQGSQESRSFGGGNREDRRGAYGGGRDRKPSGGRPGERKFGGGGKSSGRMGNGGGPKKGGPRRPRG